MGTFRKRGGYFFFSSILLVNLIVCCRCDSTKDPANLLLRPPSSVGSGPIYSTSIESIPVSSASSNQQAVYAKGSNYISSGGGAIGDQSTGSGSSGSSGSGGRNNNNNNNNNNNWYNPASSGSNPGFSYEYSGSETGTSLSSSHLSGTSGSSYYDPPPSPSSTHHVSSSATADAYAPPTTHGPSYTYFYQHYPTSSNHHGNGWSSGGDETGASNIFGDLQLPSFSGLGGIGGGGGGLVGAKAIKVIAAIAKIILKIKPFLIILLLIAIAIPVVLLLTPIPIITISAQPAQLRSARSSAQQLTSYVTQLTGKVLNAEECLERIICKLPQAPEKYQKHAKMIWDEHGSKMVKNQRVVRGLNAYFENSSQKNKSLKCDQRFRCSNKYF